MKENGYKITRVLDAVFELKKGGKKVYIKNRDLGLNPSLSDKIAKNKALAFEILYRNNIKAVPHYEIYHPEVFAVYGNQKSRNKKRIEMVIKKESLPLVIKPAEGSSGEGVMVVNNKREISKISKELFKKNDSIVLSPFRLIEHEYRVIILNGKVELIFDKIRTDKNEFRHNLCLGAKPEIIKSDDKRYKKLETIAKRAAKILNLEFTSVDIIETKEFGLEILEINGTVCMDHFAKAKEENYKIVKSIYKKALKKALK